MLAVIYGSGSDQSGRGTNHIFDQASVNVEWRKAEPKSKVKNTWAEMLVQNVGAGKRLLTNHFVSFTLLEFYDSVRILISRKHREPETFTLNCYDLYSQRKENVGESKRRRRNLSSCQQLVQKMSKHL